MRKTRVVKLGGGKFFEAVNKNNALFLMLAAFLTGVLIGAFKIKNQNEEFGLLIAQRLEEYIALRQVKNFLLVLFKACLSWLPVLAVSFLCGTSLAGSVTVPLVIGYFGYKYGALSAYLYSVFSIKGIGFCLLMVLPSTAIAAFTLMLACRESFSFSLMMAKMTLQTKGAAQLYFDFKNYCLRYSFLLLIMMASSLVDCLFFKAFGGFFSF